MENITGFIVEVRTRGERPVAYDYGGDLATLNAGEPFIGYVYMMTQKGEFHENKPFIMAHIDKIEIVDREKRTFKYNQKAVFNLNEVTVKIWGLRGPESNNTCLPEKFKRYDTWNAIDLPSSF